VTKRPNQVLEVLQGPTIQFQHPFFVISAKENLDPIRISLGGFLGKHLSNTGVYVVIFLPERQTLKALTGFELVFFSKACWA